VTARLSLSAGEGWLAWDYADVAVTREGGSPGPVLFEWGYQVAHSRADLIVRPADARDSALRCVGGYRVAKQSGIPEVDAALDALWASPAMLPFWTEAISFRRAARFAGRGRRGVEHLLAGCTCHAGPAAPHWGCAEVAQNIDLLGEDAVELAPYRYATGSQERDAAWSLREDWRGGADDLHAVIGGLFATPGAP